MKNLISSWRLFLKEESKVDSKKVAKVVIVDDQNHVLFLRRTNYVEKFAGEWDLPGGHVHVGEDLVDGAKRETQEETNLEVHRPILVTKIENIYFFKAKYSGEDLILSDEHSEYEFRDPLAIENPSKFEKVAQMVIKDD